MRLPQKLRALIRDAEETKRSIEATQPILDEAVKRTNNSYIAVEEETRVAAALIRDLDDGWYGNR